jgi:hypothetical protein
MVHYFGGRRTRKNNILNILKKNYRGNLNTTIDMNNNPTTRKNNKGNNKNKSGNKSNNPTNLNSGFNERMNQPLQFVARRPCTEKEIRITNQIFAFFGESL